MTAQGIDRLPVLVYGTLRAGQRNYAHLLAGRTVSEITGRVAGIEMYDNGSFPYAVRTGEVADVVTGDLMTIDPEVYDQVLADLDRLEGYRAGNPHSHYVRETVEVEVDGVAHTAWIYIAGPGITRRIQQLRRIPSGDWLAKYQPQT